jgi:hypothetical protein
MCITSQYLYICLHPASYRFRTSICRNPASSSCRIRDENSALPYACPKCAVKLRIQKRKQATEQIQRNTDINIMVAKKTWYIPSRCFIDTGFQNLDPFGTEVKTESTEHSSLRSPPSPIPKVPLIVDERYVNVWDAKPPRQPSPCCLKSARVGAYQATRLEGIEDRQRGRIMDSFCGSMW